MNDGVIKIKTYGTGITFTGVLGIVFIVLKLLNVIDWSWWLVTLPLWAWIAIFIVTLIIVFIVWLIQKIISVIKRKMRYRT